MWVLVRALNKMVRHFYHAYTACGFKFKCYWIDYIRMTSFYLFYPAEYIISNLLVFATLPVLKKNSSFVFQEKIGLSIDFAILHFFYVCMSLPHFFNTFVYLHRKRLQQLYIAKQVSAESAPEEQDESHDEADSILSTPVKPRKGRKSV